MKFIKKTIAALLISTFALSFVACGKTTYDKKKEQFIDICESMDYEEIDQKKAKKYMDDLDADWDGFYTSFEDSKTIKKLSEKFSSSSSSDVVSLFLASHKIIKNGSKHAIFIYIYELEDEDAAEDFYEDTLESLEEVTAPIYSTYDSLVDTGDVEIAVIDKEKNDRYRFCYSIVSDDYDMDSFTSYDVILEENTVTIIVGAVNVDNNKSIRSDYEDIYDGLDDKSPLEMVEWK